MKKTDSISPFEKGEKQTLLPRHCVTVRLPAIIVRRTDTPRPDKPRPTTTIPASDDERKKKKTGAGHDLGEGDELGVRIEVGVRVQDEETQGETQTPHGVWVSPAPERESEREKKNKNVVGESTKQQKERGDTDIKQTRGGS